MFQSAVGFAKREKRGILREQGGGFLHFFKIQQRELWVKPGRFGLKRVLLERKMVFVSPFEGVKSGVGLGLHEPNVVNGDVFGQNAVQAIQKGRRQSIISIKMGNIEAGMYARIGSSAACNVYFLP